MAKDFTDIVPDAVITIVIDAFTGSWVTPPPGQTAFTVNNCLPQAFIPVINPSVQSRFIIVQPAGIAPGQQYVPGLITISGTGALTICFKVISGVGSAATTYTETGLIFGWLSSGAPPAVLPDGRDAFPDFISNDRGIIVTDSAGFASSYEFMLVIQSPTGGVAVVDPRITNSS